MRLPLGAAALLCASGCALASLYREPLSPAAELVKARTEDGWEVALIHYPPVGEKSGPPVLLCHGISANARNMDLDETHSLARWLADRGRETFAISLRGGGDSDMPDPKAGRPFLYSIDTFARQDIPAALAKIRAITFAPRVDYVGHSMGGLVGYIYLARGGDGFNSFTALGSPVRFTWGRDVESVLKWAAKLLKDRIDFLDTHLLVDMLTPLHGEVHTVADDILYNPENVPKPLWKKFVATGVSTISGGVLQQFALWLERDAMLSAEGDRDYLAALRGVTVPAFVVAGKADRFAPAPSVKLGFEALGGEKQFFIAGEENGFLHDYGHMDMVVGDRAGQELWPRIFAFLQAHARR
jgi:pimeloyl-ACP methyl ester carboxylesterase